MKKNRYVNNTLFYYKKPILLSLIICILGVVCSFLLIKVNHIEKTQTKPMVLLIYTIEDPNQSSYYFYFNQHPEIEFKNYPSKIEKSNYEQLLEVQKYPVQARMTSYSLIYFYETCIFISQDGFIQKTLTDFTLSEIIQHLEEWGWVNESRM